MGGAASSVVKLPKVPGIPIDYASIQKAIHPIHIINGGHIMLLFDCPEVSQDHTVFNMVVRYPYGYFNHRADVGNDGNWIEQSFANLTVAGFKTILEDIAYRPWRFMNDDGNSIFIQDDHPSPTTVAPDQQYQYLSYLKSHFQFNTADENACRGDAVTYGKSISITMYDPQTYRAVGSTTVNMFNFFQNYYNNNGKFKLEIKPSAEIWTSSSADSSITVNLASAFARALQDTNHALYGTQAIWFVETSKGSVNIDTYDSAIDGSISGVYAQVSMYTQPQSGILELDPPDNNAFAYGTDANLELMATILHTAFTTGISIPVSFAKDLLNSGISGSNITQATQIFMKLQVKMGANGLRLDHFTSKTMCYPLQLRSVAGEATSAKFQGTAGGTKPTSLTWFNFDTGDDCKNIQVKVPFTVEEDEQHGIGTTGKAVLTTGQQSSSQLVPGTCGIVTLPFLSYKGEAYGIQLQLSRQFAQCFQTYSTAFRSFIELLRKLSSRTDPEDEERSVANTYRKQLQNIYASLLENGRIFTVDASMSDVHAGVLVYDNSFSEINGYVKKIDNGELGKVIDKIPELDTEYNGVKGNISNMVNAHEVLMRLASSKGVDNGHPSATNARSSALQALLHKTATSGVANAGQTKTHKKIMGLSLPLFIGLVVGLAVLIALAVTLGVLFKNKT